MESNLNGLAILKNVSTDNVVKIIQTFIAEGYKGEELLEKINETFCSISS